MNLFISSMLSRSPRQRNSNGTEQGYASRGGSRAAKEVFEIDQSATTGAGMDEAEERGMKQRECLDYKTKSAQMQQTYSEKMC